MILFTKKIEYVDNRSHFVLLVSGYLFHLFRKKKVRYSAPKVIYNYWVFSSPELDAHATFLIRKCLASVYPSVCYKLFVFFDLLRTTAYQVTRLARNISLEVLFHYGVISHSRWFFFIGWDIYDLFSRTTACPIVTTRPFSLTLQITS